MFHFATVPLFSPSLLSNEFVARMKFLQDRPSFAGIISLYSSQIDDLALLYFTQFGLPERFVDAPTKSLHKSLEFEASIGTTFLFFVL